ncbi:MAG: hypothetical protein COA45_11240 [Zetaproteobacteria bacterium]|nr:MAG: hypothetical protein COA45_11240 [Zetaproteobacteria bacterium]
MGQDNELSNDFTKSHVIDATETVSDLKQKVAVAEVRDFIAEFIHKGVHVFDVDKQNVHDFISISTEDQTEWLKRITTQALSEQGLDTSQSHIDTTYESALESVAVQIQSLANKLQEQNNLSSLTN